MSAPASEPGRMGERPDDATFEEWCRDDRSLVVREARRARAAEDLQDELISSLITGMNEPQAERDALSERLRVAREALEQVCDVTPDGPRRMEDRLYLIATIAANALKGEK